MDTNISKNKISKYMSSSIEGIVLGYRDIEKVHSIEKEREEVMGSIEFQQWCKRYNIGSRVESSSIRANELMAQYTNYAEWAKKI